MRWLHHLNCVSWRRWFAWYPVMAGNYVAWLETVEYRCFYTEDRRHNWEFRLCTRA